MSFEVERGQILVYRVFDIAEEVDLLQAEKIFLKVTTQQERLKLSRTIRHTIIIRNAPIMVNLGEIEMQILGKTIRAELFGKIWDYGVVSIIFQIPIQDGTQGEELVKIASALEDYGSIDASARRRAEDLSRILEPALKDPHSWVVYEDYVIYFFEKLRGLGKTLELANKSDIARLIFGEAHQKLSDSSKATILDSVFQYSEDDLAIIDWNSAIVVDPSGQKDVPEVLEFALTHLMEMRYYDDLLDQRLNLLYDGIEKSRGQIFGSSYQALSREASTRYIEFSEFIERVDNSLKVVGDFYLATIFRNAGIQFRLADWQASITRKMNLLARVSDLIQGETNTRRSLLLEITIVFLILFEIVSAFWKWSS